MRSGNYLDHLCCEVEEKGVVEKPYGFFLSIAFKGDDAFEKIEAWAKSRGLTVSFDNDRRVCVLRAVPRSTASRPI